MLTVADQHKRDVVRVQTARAMDDKDAERMRRDQPMQRVAVLFGEMSGDIHKRAFCGRAFTPSCRSAAHKAKAPTAPRPQDQFNTSTGLLR